MSVGRSGMHRVQLEEECRHMARKIKGCIPPGTGFALLLFDLGADGNMTYMSSAVRADMMRALEELLGNLRAEGS